MSSSVDEILTFPPCLEEDIAEEATPVESEEPSENVSKSPSKAFHALHQAAASLSTGFIWDDGEGPEELGWKSQWDSFKAGKNPLHFQIFTLAAIHKGLCLAFCFINLTFET
jgi:hypothetical protein